MNQSDSVYILRLIEASKLMNEDQKGKMKARLNELDATQLGSLTMALENEQRVLAEYYKNVAHLRKIAASKKVKAYYDHAEETIAQREEVELNEIENELSNI